MGGGRKMSRVSDPHSSGAALLIQSREHVVVSARWLMAALMFSVAALKSLFVFIVLFNCYGQFVSLLHFLNC